MKNSTTEKEWYLLGFSQKQISSISNALKKDNLRILKHITIYVSSLLFLCSPFPLVFKKSKFEFFLYFLLASISLIIYFTSRYSLKKEIYNKSSKKIIFFYYAQLLVFVLVVYFFGMYLGLHTGDGYQATVFFMILICFGNLFSLSLLSNFGPMILVLLIFIPLSISRKSSSVWPYDVVNSIISLFLNGFIYWQTNTLRIKQKLEELRLSDTNVALWDMSNKDFLTKLYNRRKFTEESQKLLIARDLSKGTLAIAMIDIDDFRAYNEMYGHDNGDSALILISEQFINCAVKHDIVICRWGGEEFMAMWPVETSEAAQHDAEEVRQCIEDLKIANSPMNGAKYLTVSIGLHVLSGKHTETWEEMYHNTYELLSRAKSHGRNRIEFSLN